MMFEHIAKIRSLEERVPCFVIERVGDNDYIVEVHGVRCHAIFNPYRGIYYADDVDGIVGGGQE